MFGSMTRFNSVSVDTADNSLGIVPFRFIKANNGVEREVEVRSLISG